MPALFNNDNRHRTYVGQGEFSMEMKINTGSSCKSCDDIMATNGSHCNSGTVLVIRWNNVCVIALYFVEFIVLLAVFLCFMYFWKNKNSPLVKSCYSWPDNVTLAVLGLFCLLPVLHIGELSTERCMFLSPVVNVIFAFYAGLLLTKTLSVQNLLKCQTVSENPARRMAFCVFIVILQVIVLATLPFSGFPNLVRFSCPGLGPAHAREVVTLCDIQGNLSILGCMLYNWICLLLLSSISLFEMFKHSRDLRRTGNLPAVAFVGLLSYTCLTTCAYFDLQLEHYMLVTLALYVVYLINPVICLGALYIPTICLILTCLQQQKNFQKKSKVMSPRRNSPAMDSVFSYLVKSNVGPEHPSLSWSPYSSGVSHLSYPSSLVCGVRESVRVVSSFVASVEAVNHARSFQRFHDNVSWTVIPRAEDCKSSPGQGISTPELFNESDGEYSDIEFTYQGQLKDWFSILNGLESSDV